MYGLSIFSNPKFLEPIGNPNSKIKIFLLNGLNNNEKESRENGLVLYNNLSKINTDISVVPFYPGYENRILDGISAVFQRIGFYEPKRVGVIKERFTTEIDQMRQNNNNNKLFVASFSRGGLDGFQAFEKMDKSYLKDIMCCNMGFAKGIPNDMVYDATNYRIKGDLVPTFCDSFACTGIKKEGFNIIPNSYNTIDLPKSDFEHPTHRFINNGYQDALYKNFKNYNNNGLSYEK